MTKKQYPTDLTPEQFAVIEPTLCTQSNMGRPRKWGLLEVMNAIQYLLRSGCAWRLLPHDFPPWQTIYSYFRKWKRDGTWEKIHNVLHERVRSEEDREPNPTAAIIDSQSVKTTDVPGPRGYDAGKKTKGRKRHIVVDTLGFLIAIVVHPANIQDRDGAKIVLKKAYQRFCSLQIIWADSGYSGQLIDWVKVTFGIILEIVKRPTQIKCFTVIRKRWIVERTFGWLSRYRRLSKDYEGLTSTSEAMAQIAMINLMVHRLVPGSAQGGR
jgi:putative transposase